MHLKDTFALAELKEEDLETEVKALIDRLKQINFKARVQVIKNLSDIIAFRRPISEENKYIDTRPLCVNKKGIDLDERLCEIESEERKTWSKKYLIEYRGYFYDIIDHSAQEEDQGSFEETGNTESSGE